MEIIRYSYFVLMLTCIFTTASAQTNEKDIFGNPLRERSKYQPFIYGAVSTTEGSWFSNTARQNQTPGSINLGLEGQGKDFITSEIGVSIYHGFGLTGHYFEAHINGATSSGYSITTKGIGPMYTHTLWRSFGHRRGVYADAQLLYMQATVYQNFVIQELGSFSDDEHFRYYQQYSLQPRSGDFEGFMANLQLRMRTYLGTTFLLKASYYYSGRQTFVHDKYIDTRFPLHVGSNRTDYSFNCFALSLGIGITLYVPDKAPGKLHYKPYNLEGI